MPLPNDPVMLLSYINTQLRDHYSDLEDLCLSLSEDKEVIIEKLGKIQYFYSREKNQFV